MSGLGNPWVLVCPINSRIGSQFHCKCHCCLVRLTHGSQIVFQGLGLRFDTGWCFKLNSKEFYKRPSCSGPNILSGALGGVGEVYHARLLTICEDDKLLPARLLDYAPKSITLNPIL